MEPDEDQIRLEDPRELEPIEDPVGRKGGNRLGRRVPYHSEAGIGLIRRRERRVDGADLVPAPSERLEYALPAYEGDLSLL
jgi:hypothetical protein